MYHGISQILGLVRLLTNIQKDNLCCAASKLSPDFTLNMLFRGDRWCASLLGVRIQAVDAVAQKPPACPCVWNPARECRCTGCPIPSTEQHLVPPSHITTMPPPPEASCCGCRAHQHTRLRRSTANILPGLPGCEYVRSLL